MPTERRCTCDPGDEGGCPWCIEGEEEGDRRLLAGVKTLILLGCIVIGAAAWVAHWIRA